MPTASPAVSKQSNTYTDQGAQRRRAHLARFLALLIAIPIAASFAAADPLPVAAKESARGCAKWHSLSQPPPTIRVLRRRSNKVEVVPFRKYVKVVMGKEWPSYLPMAVVAAGAVVVKQYAWYHAMYTRRMSKGRCFDVKDGTGDQLYKPNRSRVRPDHNVALDMTWDVTLRKHGRFFMTGYRRGDKVRCGRDATGHKLFARSAVRCAEKGWNWRQILRRYYAPGLDIVGDGGGDESNASHRGAASAGTTAGTLRAEAAANTRATTDTTRPTDSAGLTSAERSSPATIGSADVAGGTRHVYLGGSALAFWFVGGSLALVGALGHGHGWLGAWATGRRKQRTELISATDRAAVTLVERGWQRDAL